MSPSPRTREDYKNKYLFDVMPFTAALLDAEIGAATLELLANAYRNATSRGGDPTRGAECFGCCRPWSLTRSPVVVVKIEGIAGAKFPTVLAGLCGECCAPPELVGRVVAAAAARDFGGGQPMEVRQVHRGGVA
jgi:hypothetical protein